MKLSTLALCSTLGMVLTSASVWGLTPPATGKPAPASPVAPTGPATPAVGTPQGGGLVSLLGGGNGTTSTATASGPIFDAGDTVRLEGRLGHAILDATTGGETFMMLRARAAADELAATPAPVNLSIVVDRSRSMEGKRISNAMEAARGMVRRLRPGDTVNVVAYNTTTELLVPATTIDERSRGEVLFALRGVEARGHTCISCGIEAGLQNMGRRTDAVSRMLLLSDGEANFGIKDVDGFRRLARTARDADVAISSVGVDVDYNERVMFAVAQESNGRHYFVENTSGLPRIFDEELSTLVQTVASSGRVEIDLAPGVRVLDVLDRAFERDGDRLIVPLGSFASGSEKTVLVRMRVPGGQAGERSIADVRMFYDDLAKDRRGDCRGELVARLTTDRSEVSDLDPVVETRVGRSETAAALARANDLFSSGQLEEAKREIADNRSRIRRRRDQAKKKSKGRVQQQIGTDFEQQLSTLDLAEENFAQAADEAPAAPATSRKGKAAVRNNAGQLDDLLQ